MDKRKYYTITHQNHVFCNPMSAEKFDELLELLPLEKGARVLDVACGKAEFLTRIATRHATSGLGIDIAPVEVQAARAKIRTLGLDGQIEIVEADGADVPLAPASFDLAMCIGATWVWQDYAGTIEALKAAVVPGGLIAIGEPFKRREPHPDFVAADPDFVPHLVTHAENVEIGQRHGLTMLYTMVGSADDWDRYEGLQTLAAERYVRENPDDPDGEELMSLRREYDAVHFKWARDTLGWAIYLFRAP